MNIELTAIEAGSLVLFSLGVCGVVMALRLRSRRRKKQQVKQDVSEYEFKTNPETLAPEKVEKNPSQPEQIDTDALLKDLKKDSDKE